MEATRPHLSLSLSLSPLDRTLSQRPGEWSGGLRFERGEEGKKGAIIHEITLRLKRSIYPVISAETGGRAHSLRICSRLLLRVRSQMRPISETAKKIKNEGPDPRVDDENINYLHFPSFVTVGPFLSP